MTKEDKRKQANKVANNLKDVLTNLCNEIERYDLQQDTLTLYFNLIKTAVETQSKDTTKNIDLILEYARPLNNIIYLLNLIDRKQGYITNLDNTNKAIVQRIVKELSNYCNWFNKL